MWLVPNLVLCVVYFFRRRSLLLLFFAACPYVGFAVYYTPRILLYFSSPTTTDLEEYGARMVGVDRVYRKQSVSRHLNVVPVSDAVAIGTVHERRALLVQALTQDTTSDCSNLLAALDDSDSETVHYVSAARTQLCGALQTAWIKANKAYNKDMTRCTFEAVCSVLMEALNCGVLSSQERTLYCTHVLKTFASWDGELTLAQRDLYLTAMVQLNMYERAAEYITASDNPRLRFIVAVRTKSDVAANALLSTLDQEEQEYWRCRL